MSLITATKMTDGYGAACFVVPGEGFTRREIEVQVHPTKVNVYLNTSIPYPTRGHHARRAVLTDMTARDIAAEVCNGNCWLDVLADHVEENGAATCDHDFDLARLLRKAS